MDPLEIVANVLAKAYYPNTQLIYLIPLKTNPKN